MNHEVNRVDLRCLLGFRLGALRAQPVGDTAVSLIGCKKGMKPQQSARARCEAPVQSRSSG